MDGGEDYFCIDSKLIEVCRIARGKRCKMGRTGDFNKAPDLGYCASQGSYFFGYKLHVLCGLIPKYIAASAKASLRLAKVSDIP
jgi:hypothetical protein